MGIRIGPALGPLLMVALVGTAVLRGSSLPAAPADGRPPDDALLAAPADGRPPDDALLAASAEAQHARTPSEAAALGGLDMHFPAQLDTFHFFNTEPTETTVNLGWYDLAGGPPVLQQSVVIPGRDLVVFPLPAHNRPRPGAAPCVWARS